MSDRSRGKAVWSALIVALLPWVKWIPARRYLPAVLLAIHDGATTFLLTRAATMKAGTMAGAEITLIVAILVCVSVLLRVFAAVGSVRARRGSEASPGTAHRIVQKLSGDAKGITGLLVLMVLGYVALAAPLLVGDPLMMNFADTLKPPSAAHLMGTDMYGRDILSRIMYGARYTLGIGITATVLNVALGALLGLLAGFFRGPVDAAIMRIFEILNSIPFLMLAILIVAVFGSSIPMLILVLSIFVLQPARIVRGQVLELRETAYVQAAWASGAGTLRVIFRHILPNVLPTLLVVMSIRVGQNILSLAGLSFLGMGITPPTPSWGSMLQEGRAYILNAVWLGAFPGAAIFVTVLAFNLLGDSLRDALDPRLGGRQGSATRLGVRLRSAARG